MWKKPYLFAALTLIPSLASAQTTVCTYAEQNGAIKNCIGTTPLGPTGTAGPQTGANSLSVVPNTDTPFPVVGNTAAGTTDSGNGVKVSGVYNTTPPTYTNGQRSDIQTDSRGGIITEIKGNGSSSFVNVSSLSADANAVSTALWSNAQNAVFNGTNWDRQRGDTNGLWVEGGVAAGSADAGFPVKIGGKYNATKPTYADGNRGDAQLGTRGSMNVQLSLPDSATPVSFTGTAADAFANSGLNAYSGVTFGYVFNGTSWDRVKKINLYKRVASSAGSGNPDFVKASAGDVWRWWGQNGAAITYLQIYNKASAPTIGTDTPVLTFPIPANAAFSESIGMGGAYMSTGIAFAFTTDAAGTTGAAAAAVTSFAMLAD